MALVRWQVQLCPARQDALGWHVQVLRILLEMRWVHLRPFIPAARSCLEVMSLSHTAGWRVLKEASVLLGLALLWRVSSIKPESDTVWSLLLKCYVHTGHVIHILRMQVLECAFRFFFVPTGLSLPDTGASPPAVFGRDLMQSFEEMQISLILLQTS